MKFFSILLKEGRKEDLKKKYANKFDEETLDWFLNIADLQDFNHKYTDFVLKGVHPDHIEGDTEIGINLIQSFDKYQSELEKKDINQYKSFEELDNALTPLYQKKKEKELEKQVEKIYEDDKFLVVKPKTHEASCKYGSNTKWCTTAQSPDHFQRYTSGSQGLYYIINKANSNNKTYSKVAIHFDNSGDSRYWDSKDSPMSQKEIEIFNYAFPEIVEKIEKDYETIRVSAEQKILNEVFNVWAITKRSDKNLYGSDSELTVSVEGFQTINDLGQGHAEASLAVILENVLIDEYQVFITFSPQDKRTFNASIGFMGKDNYIEEDNFIDLGLEDFGIDSKYIISETLQNTAEGVRTHIASRILIHIKENPKMQEKVAGSSRVFRSTYGYKFGKNRGWVKKLVDYLDKGEIGTKLDFLTDIGYLEKITQDGKTQFRKSKLGFLYNPRDLRGQHSSFFAAAKNAGILNYRKIGKDYFLIKGPNFEAFKEGKLKAL
jgi:hypothetical protein